MKIAYIIHAYKLPNQLEKLVEVLFTPNTYFFIHIDKKVDILPFKQALSKHGSNVIWVEREYSNWGTKSCVKAVLNALFTALHHIEYFEYFYCLSGQDYPIKPARLIEDFFKKNKDTDFVGYFSLPTLNWKGGGMHRYNRFHFIISKNRYVCRFVNSINFFLPRRKMPYNLKLFGGEFYFGLKRESVKYIENFTQKHPLYLIFFRFSYIPEEVFFQTILLNGTENIKERIVNKNLTYVDWSKPCGPYPATLNESDMPKLISSECLFARKFDVRVDNNILELIDKNLLR